MLASAHIIADSVDPRDYHKRDKQRGDPAFAERLEESKGVKK